MATTERCQAEVKRNCAGVCGHSQWDHTRGNQYQPGKCRVCERVAASPMRHDFLCGRGEGGGDGG